VAQISKADRLQQLAADIERWRSMPVVCVNEPDPERAAHVMRLVVECNLRQLEAEPVYPPNTPPEVK
jgi:hypothetical protein